MRLSWGSGPRAAENRRRLRHRLRQRGTSKCPNPSTGRAERFCGVVPAGAASDRCITGACAKLPQPTSSAQQLPRVTPAVTRSASRKQAPTMTSTSESSTEPPQPASPVSLPKAPVASASSQTVPAPQPPLLPSSEQQEAPVASEPSEAVPAPPPSASSAKQKPRISPAVTRSASRQQGGLGHRHGLVSMLAAREDAGMSIVDQSPPHIPASELPSCLASELVTPDRYAQACMDVQADLWLKSTASEYGGLSSAGTFTVVKENGGDT